MKLLLVLFVVFNLAFIKKTFAALHPSCITSRDVYDFELAQKLCLEDSFYEIKECPGKYKCYAKEGEECVFSNSINAKRRFCKKNLHCDFITPNSKEIVCRSYFDKKKKSVDSFNSIQKKSLFDYIVYKMKPFNQPIYDKKMEV